MTEYELSLRREVLLEKGADVLGELFRTGLAYEGGVYEETWNLKRAVLTAADAVSLACIEERFDRVRSIHVTHGTRERTHVADPEHFSSSDIERIADVEETLSRKHFAAHGSPRAYLLAGQPGSGKTPLSSMLVTQHGGDAVLINADEYRCFHPYYRQLQSERGADASLYTSAFSGSVTRSVIDRLSNAQLDLVIEGTGRTVDVPRSTAELLCSKGYSVELAVMAVRPAQSLASTLLRYHAMAESGTTPRATPLAAHEIKVSALPGNLDRLVELPCISRVTLWDRELRQLYDSAASTEQPSEALTRFWNRPLSDGEREIIMSQITQLRRAERENGADFHSALDELERKVGA